MPQPEMPRRYLLVSCRNNANSNFEVKRTLVLFVPTRGINYGLRVCPIRGHVVARRCKCQQIVQLYHIIAYGPEHEKTDDFGSDQVPHKSACTVTKDGWKF